jgi:PAS domain S-box-containing protein
MLNEAGEMVGAVAVNRDISDFKRTRAALAQERNTLRTLLDNLLDFVYVKDREGRFTLANASLAQFMGVDSPQELIGKTDLELHCWEEVAGFWADELHVMESGEPIINKYETNTRPESGTQFTVLTTKLPYRNDKGEVIGIIGFSRDVTALSEAERLRAEKEKLEVALDKERELSQLKVDFMATAAHEFRTPLTIIQTSSAMLNNYWGRMDEASRRNKLTGIEAQVSHLSKLLDELGLSIQAERGQIRYAPGWVDVLELVKRLSEEVQPMLNKKHHFEMIHPAEMDTLYLDGELIYSGLLILVSNAIKYSPNGGPVTLTLSTTKEHLQVIVQDRGIGIPDDDQNRLLDPFFRGSNVGTIRGTGSGLSIVKEIVDLHSGDIRIESQLNQGATFTVTLPISQNGG